MKTSINFLIRGSIVILFTWAMIACQPKKSVDLTEVEKSAIREFNDKCLTMARELNKDNADAFVKYAYAENAVIFPPNAQSLKGQEALIGMYQNYPSMTDFNQVIEEVEIFGNYAYLRLNYSIPIRLPEVESSEDTGPIFCILQKQEDGSWKIWREIWNSDVPMPVAPAPKP
jgi:ketosteroid isomerase-like protein